jgi:hypothetical protein
MAIKAIRDFLKKRNEELAALVKQIIAAHKLEEDSDREKLKQVRIQGKAFLDARKQFKGKPKGAWGKWCREQFPNISKRRIEQYMDFAKTKSTSLLEDWKKWQKCSGNDSGNSPGKNPKPNDQPGKATPNGQPDDEHKEPDKDDLGALVEAADDNKNQKEQMAAQKRLEALALEAGVSKKATDAAKTWSDVKTLIEKGDQEDEDQEEEKSTPKKGNGTPAPGGKNRVPGGKNGTPGKAAPEANLPEKEPDEPQPLLVELGPADKDRLADLMKAWKLKTETEAIVSAIRTCHVEVCNGKR